MARISLERGISYDGRRALYYVYMDYGRAEDGARVRRYRTFPSLSAARKALRAFQAERSLRVAVVPQITTLSQWLAHWMEQVVIPNRAETTAYGYRNIIENHLSPALGDVPIQQLGARHLQQYYAMLLSEKGLSPSTVRRHHDLLSAALRTAMRQEMIALCPTERVVPPRAVSREARYYGPAELKRLYALVEGHPLELVVRLAGSLGLRREEICGLRWSSVSFERGRIHICAARTAAGGRIIQKETKNRSSNRTLHMTDDIYLFLQRERTRQLRLAGGNWSDSGLVAVDGRGQPFPPNALSLAFTRFIRCSGLPPLTLHGLRHTFATVASAQGAPLFEIGKALGHSTPAVTGRIYTHLADHTHEATLARVASALK